MSRWKIPGDSATKKAYRSFPRIANSARLDTTHNHIISPVTLCQH